MRKCLLKNDVFKLSFNEFSIRIFQLHSSFKILFTVISFHVKFIFMCLNCFLLNEVPLIFLSLVRFNQLNHF